MGTGLAKEIEASALPLILDNLQKYQYQYPIKSTIREIASNAYDSVQEKLAAGKILRGEAKVEDYFIHRTEDLYKDSNWDPMYYDLKHLHPAAHNVLIRYVEGKNFDTVEVMDYGIGIGGKRLSGYFKLGYSTKRNTKLALGKFGIGAKVPLSTGVDFYTMETRYNGRLFRFNIYDHKVESLVPAMNLETGGWRSHTTLGAGDNTMPAYYEEQEGYNYTKISWRVKKHHKQQYIQAVHQQLLYFTAIRFEIVDATGRTEVSNPQAEILYEDDYLVVSDNAQFAKPHLLINNVCYGYVDWQELELEDRGGNVALKVRMEDITVNPSRESVIWNDSTRATILKRIEDGIKSATGLIERELKSDDLWTWLKTVANLAIRRDNSVVGRLAQFSGASTFNPGFTLPNGRKIHTGTVGYLLDLFFTMETGELVKTSKKVKYEKRPAFLRDLFDYPAYWTEEENKTLRKRKYLCHDCTSRCTFINLNYKFQDIGKLVARINDESPSFAKKPIDAEELLELIEDLRIGLMELLTSYDDIEVPEDFSLTEQEEEDVKEEDVAEKVKKEKPKRTGTVNAKVPLGHFSGTAQLVIAEDRIRNINLPEVFVGTMNKEDDKRAQFISAICYGRSKGRKIDPVTRKAVPAGESLGWDATIRANRYNPDWHLEQVTALCNEVYGGERQNYAYHAAYPHGKDTGAICLQLSQEWYRKVIDKYYTYEEFFLRIENDGRRIAMSGILQKWYTAQLIEHAVVKYRFLYHMQDVAPELAEKYRKIYHHWHKYGVDVVKNGKVDETSFTEMMEFCNKVATLQKECENPEKSETDILTMSKQLFQGEFAEAKAYDSELASIAKELEDLEPLIALCAQLQFTYPGTPLSGLSQQPRLQLTHDQEVAVREYFQFKGLNPQ